MHQSHVPYFVSFFSQVSITAITYCSYVELSSPSFFLPGCNIIIMIDERELFTPIRLETRAVWDVVICEPDHSVAGGVTDTLTLEGKNEIKIMGGS